MSFNLYCFWEIHQAYSKLSQFQSHRTTQLACGQQTVLTSGQNRIDSLASKHKLKTHSSLNIHSHGVDISAQEDITYLGAKIQQDLSGESMANSIINKSNARLKYIYRQCIFISTRHSTSSLVTTIPKSNTFEYTGVQLWNSLHVNIKEIDKRLTFKEKSGLSCLTNCKWMNKFVSN